MLIGIGHLYTTLMFNLQTGEMGIAVLLSKRLLEILVHVIIL